MKIAQISTLILTAAIALSGMTGCKKAPKNVTTIPGADVKVKTQDNAGGSLPPVNNLNNPPINIGDRPTGNQLGQLPGGPGGNGDLGAGVRPNGPEDHEKLRAQTIYFDFDKAEVKKAELSKLDAVASFLKSTPAARLKIEGNCDERGTEEYNRSLGERRAQSAFQALVAMGIDANRMTTVSLGEDNPADPGHEEAAWSKNRRDEFVVVGQ